MIARAETGRAPEAWELERRLCERRNAVTHAVGLAMSLPAVYWLLKQTQTTADLRGAFVYGLTLIFVYAASTSLHLAIGRPLQNRLEVLDHCAIYLLIAGTFSPFLIRLGGATSQRLLICGWSMAAAGVGFKCVFGLKHQCISIASYLAMGWFPLLFFQEILRATSWAAVEWLIIGGAAYTAGVPFFLAAYKRPRLHAIWHLFVMLGSACHYIAVLFCLRA